MSYDVGNFRIYTGLIQVENDSNLHGYLDVGFRVKYLDTAGYNTIRSWIERQESDMSWVTLSFQYDFGIPAANQNGPGYINTHEGGGSEFYDWNPLGTETGLVLSETGASGASFSTGNIGIYRIAFDPGVGTNMGVNWRSEESGGQPVEYLSIEFNYPYDPNTDDGDGGDGDGGDGDGPIESPSSTYIKVPYFAEITNISPDNVLTVSSSWNTFKQRMGFEANQNRLTATNTFSSWSLSYKHLDKRDLNTYLHFGADKMIRVTNVTKDDTLFENYPYSTVYKLYEPLSEDIEERAQVFVVREVKPQKTEVVNLISYEQEEEDVLVLRVPDNELVDSPITKRSTDYKSYSDLVASGSQLQDDIIDKFLSGSKKSVELNVDYSAYSNYINFSSIEKRLGNFKYKVQLIESYTAQSSSFVAVTSGSDDTQLYHNKIRELKNNFDGYENYLYHVSSSYVTSSMGEFTNASWPKTGGGTYADPYKPITSSHSSFTDWYGSIGSKTGQIYSASLYDKDNKNRLANLLPLHVIENTENNEFIDFIDMIGQHFDELWLYTKSISDITDRQIDLGKGFPKALIFDIAKSLGWDIQDGKDLLSLSRVGFGQKLSGDTYSLYTSGSLSSPPEGDISKEITKRLIASMPYILKSKGTIGSLKAIINCYGIPSTILRVREYGGLLEANQRDQFEYTRKFSRALGFRGSQYITSPWTTDSDSGRTPDTIELRFKAVTGSDQILIQKDTDWAIKLKDNNLPDNYGTVAFMLNGSDGYKEISSSLLPIFDGEFYSLMLRKNKINTNLFTYPTFDTNALFNPPFTNTGGGSAAGGRIRIVSSSNVARTGTKSLEHRNTRAEDDPALSYTYLYRNSPAHPTLSASVASVSQGETYTFSAYAKVSASNVDSVGKLVVFELDSGGAVVNWHNESDMGPNGEGGYKTSEVIGLNETEWKQIQVQKTIKFPNTTGLSVRFDNLKRGSTIYWDDVSLRKLEANTDNLIDPFNYELSVKKFDGGIDRIIYTSQANLMISSSASQSYNAAWTGSGTLYLGGGTSTSPFGASKLSGSLMEFRLWSETLQDRYFDNHVEHPKSYVGNTPSSSYYSLIRRYTLDDNTTLANGGNILDSRPNQGGTNAGTAQGFGGTNTFHGLVDRTKTMIPNHGPNRRIGSKIRIENNALSGSGATLSRTSRFDVSANDLSPIDSPKVGIYFSPTDVINEDIVMSFANLDFNQYLGDPRDNFEQHYSELKSVSDQYFQKYTGNNNFWDYMHIIRYYDQNIFKQLNRLIPARAKPNLGTLIEGNIFERPKSPIQRSNPSYENLFYEDLINISHYDEPEHEDSRSIITIESEYPVYDANIVERDIFQGSSLYDFAINYNLDDSTLYISGSAKWGGPNRVFSEPTGSVITNNRLSVYNQEYKFFYTSSAEFDSSIRSSLNRSEHFYTSKSLHSTDVDHEYYNITALNRSFFAGVKNTKDTTIDGDLPIIIKTSAPTVAMPADAGISKLRIDKSDIKRKN